jgi:hypothetical protein
VGDYIEKHGIDKRTSNCCGMRNATTEPVDIPVSRTMKLTLGVVEMPKDKSSSQGQSTSLVI